jgi:hypothetical protein
MEIYVMINNVLLIISVFLSIVVHIMIILVKITQVNKIVHIAR